MHILINVGIVVLTVIAMEFVAWFAHKFIMHGLLWKWHEDHHDPHLKDGFFERMIDSFLFLQYPPPFAIWQARFGQEWDSSCI